MGKKLARTACFAKWRVLSWRKPSYTRLLTDYRVFIADFCMDQRLRSYGSRKGTNEFSSNLRAFCALNNRIHADKVSKYDPGFDTMQRFATGLCGRYFTRYERGNRVAFGLVDQTVMPNDERNRRKSGEVAYHPVLGY